MRRWFVMAFMLLALPFQLVWAAAAPVCAHESQAAAKKHFGHHEHKHQGSTSATADTDDAADNSTGLGAYHADCESCHLGTSAALSSSTPRIMPLPNGAVHGDHCSTYRSHIPSGLERPDRLELTAAVRFGGGVEFSPLIA